MAGNGGGVRMRATGLSIHFGTFSYLQHMNYRFPYACCQEGDAVFTSQWCLQTKIGRVENSSNMLKACHLCEYVLLAYIECVDQCRCHRKMEFTRTRRSNKMGLTCVTFSVTLWVRSLTFGAMMVVSDVGGEWVFLSFPSEKLSAIRGILLMVLYLLILESDVDPSRLDFTWFKGPGGLEKKHTS